MKIHTLIALTLSLLISSCNSTSSENEALKKEIEILKKEKKLNVLNKANLSKNVSNNSNKVILTIIATINPDGKKELSHYIEKVGELYKKVNAKSINKFKITKSFIGNYRPTVVSIMEFPSMNSLNEVFESQEYKILIPFREKAFSKLEAYISE